MSQMEELYRQVIIDHSRERHGFGLRDGASGESFQLNPTCGDEVRLQVKVEEGQILWVAWEGRGCSISQASTSVLHDLVEGVDVERARGLADTFRELMQARHEPLSEEKLEILDDGAAFAGVARYPARVKCAMLGWVALLDALAEENN